MRYSEEELCGVQEVAVQEIWNGDLYVLTFLKPRETMVAVTVGATP